MGHDGPVSHREFITWQAWMDEQWNRPSRTDHYIIQLTTVLAQIHAAKNANPRMDQFKLKFTKTSEPEKPPMTKEQAAKWAKATWMGRLGMGPFNKA